MKIDLNKQYKTRGGQDVILHEITTRPVRKGGGPATFPVKGSIINITPTGQKRREFNIWTTSGMFSVLDTSDKDLIEVK